MGRIRRAEIVGSTLLAGSPLDAAQVDALLDRGRAEGGHRLDAYVLVRDYAAAAASIADARQRPRADPRLLLDLEELRRLHALATAGVTARGGAWRLGNPTLATGIVAPAAWLVARETEALVDRFGRGPNDEPLALWTARFLGRFARLVPFESANGRVARLAVNLMLRRLDIAPLVFERPDRRRFPQALAQAEAARPQALAALIATALERAANRLLAASAAASAADGDAAGDILPLRRIAGDDYGALARAAHRGRLRTIVRGGRYFTTAAWIAEYRGAVPGADAPDRSSTP
jgi:Fic family protein